MEGNDEAKSLHRHLVQFKATLTSEDHTSVISNVETLVASLEAHFDVREEPAHSRTRQVKKKTRAQLESSLKYNKKKLSRLLKEKQDIKGTKDKYGMLSRSAILRVMLADPTLPSRNLATLLNEHALGGEQVISHPKVGNIRDAFVEQIKELSAKQLQYSFSRACAEKKSLSIVLSHVHDGADMRMRSYTCTLESSEDCILPRNAPKLSRQKHSKIQNHSVQIQGLDTEALPWDVELQPLKNKTKEVVATSIIVALNGVLAALLSPEDVRDELPTVVHVLTGDSINTNEAACRIVLHYFREISSFRRRMTYRLIMWRCAAHKAALVTVTAICGR